MAGDAGGDAVLPPFLASQLQYLSLHSPLPLRVENCRKGYQGQGFVDRFSILVPCCLDHIKWNVVYNSQHPWWPPDVIFGIDDGHFQPLAANDDQGSSHSAWAILRDWNIKDPARLLRLILNLRALYLQHQRKRVEEVDDPQLRFEISTIGAMEDLEMCLIAEPDDAKEVHFAIPLKDVDLSQLRSEAQIAASMYQLTISLQVKFPVQRGKPQSSVPQLKLITSTELKEVLDTDDMKLPVWAIHMCLMEYIPMLQETLRSQVQDACTSINLRRAFMESLSLYFGRPIEADTIFCRKITVVASNGVFTFLVHFSVPIQFPKQQPTLTLQSSQHFDSRGRPILSRPYSDYPWSPRWDQTQMSQRIFDFVTDECITFKKYCSEVLLHHT
ncbi:hypothetical protein O6H91_07G005800 [Diphasiastrum complanatum]|uniref:Uncharacterized protein n=1 Tax=Diphasiastrum complanatum TaxID=34168 RepID=A0ACC2D1Z1_DIPCM|nr:hypothetical protein O6H91_07G005800 [Diphasiastrum complanatum]